MAAIEEHKPAEKRRALGRGLDSLLPSGPRVVAAPAATATAPAVLPAPVVIPSGPAVVSGAAAPAVISSRVGFAPGAAADVSVGDVVQNIPLESIDENPYQTRRTFDEAALSELAESIRASGLAQPVVLRPGTNGRYVLVLGERRCRASKLAGKTTVQAIVRALGNEQAAEMTIVENLQRQDLNCLEQAQAFVRLSREFNLTQEQIGKRTGASRESVANYMRLLKLPSSVLELVGQGKIQFSEARVLLEAAALLDPSGVEEMARNAVEHGWTVKELKSQVSKLQGIPGTVKHQLVPAKPADPNVKAAETELQRLLGMRVRISDRKGRGTIQIQYRSVEDFENVLDALRSRR